MLLAVMINVESQFYPAPILSKITCVLMTQTLSTVHDLFIPRCEICLDLLLQTHSFLGPAVIVAISSDFTQDISCQDLYCSADMYTKYCT